jgi:hypothetical protein
MARRIGDARLLANQLGGAGNHRDRRAQLVADAVDERTFAFDVALMPRDEIIERIGDHRKLGTGIGIQDDALARPLGRQFGKTGGEGTQRTHQPVHAPADRQAEHGNQQRHGGDDAGGDVDLALFQVLDVQRQRPALAFDVAHQHHPALVGKHDFIVEAGSDIAQHIRQRRTALVAVQVHGLGVRPVPAGQLLVVVEDVVELGLQQRGPQHLFGLFIDDEAVGIDRDRDQYGIDEQALHQPAT